VRGGRGGRRGFGFKIGRGREGGRWGLDGFFDGLDDGSDTGLWGWDAGEFLARERRGRWGSCRMRVAIL